MKHHEILGLDELLGAVATVAPASSPNLQKNQPLYSAGLSSMPAVYKQPVGGADSIVTLTPHVNTLPISQLVNSPFSVPGGGGGLLQPVIPNTDPSLYNFSSGGFDLPDSGGYDDEMAMEEGDTDDSTDEGLTGAGKPHPALHGRAAVAVVKQKMAQIVARVNHAKATKGASLRGLSLPINPGGVFSISQPATAPAPVDMTAALNAVNVAMGQLQQQYQQLLAQDTQEQGLAQQFANAQDLPGQTGFTASIYTALMNMDADTQNAAANVSAQIDNLNASLDNMQQQLSNLATQQQTYAQEVSNIQAAQQYANAPPVYTPPTWQPPAADQSYNQPYYATDSGDSGADYGADPFGDFSGDDMASM